MEQSFGVYILANDAVLELLITFLNSFRRFNPSIPLRLIPYDNHVRKVSDLTSLYHFSIFSDETILKRCDNVSLNFYAAPKGEFRKLACWHGNFDTFVYVDIDTVILQDLTFAKKLLLSYDFLNSHSNISTSRRFTWRESIYTTDILATDQIEYSANMGFFASKRHLFNIAGVEKVATRARAMSEHMELLCTDQPFMNFLVVTSGARYNSIHILRETHDTHLPYECWAGDPKWRVEPNGEGYYCDQPRAVFFIHWAGVWAAQSATESLSESDDNTQKRAIRQNMPLKEIWQHFRFM